MDDLWLLLAFLLALGAGVWAAVLRSWPLLAVAAAVAILCLYLAGTDIRIDTD